MSDGTIDEATEIISAWLNHDRTLNELASGIAYDDGQFGVRWMLSSLLWAPQEVRSPESLGIDLVRLQLVGSKLSPEALHAADWDHIRNLLIGE